MWSQEVCVGAYCETKECVRLRLVWHILVLRWLPCNMKLLWSTLNIFLKLPSTTFKNTLETLYELLRNLLDTSVTPSWNLLETCLKGPLKLPWITLETLFKYPCNAFKTFLEHIVTSVTQIVKNGTTLTRVKQPRRHFLKENGPWKQFHNGAIEM